MSEEVITFEDAVQERTAIETRVTQLVITRENRVQTAEDTKAVKGMQKKVDEMFIAPWRKAKADAEANRKKWDDLLMAPLVRIEGILKDKQMAFDAEEERKRKVEQDRLNAIEAERARKEREKAEAAARLQREKEAQAQREADEARRKAQEATNTAERERLQKEAEARQREASAAAAKAAAKEEAAASVVQNHIEVASAVPEIKGQSTRKTWKARVTDPKAAIGALLGFADWAAYIEINEGQLNKLAQRTKGLVPVAGVQWYEESVMASASK